MPRGLALFLLLCLSAQPAFAFNINWPERVQGFSRYVGRHSVAQGKRVESLAMRSQSFNGRVQGYLRALEMRARPFQAKPASAETRN